MISDRYALKPQPEAISKILDVTEHMASCYGFDEKAASRIRLLCEEMVLSIHSGLALVPGELWFGAKDGVFTVTASVSTAVHGIPKEQRQKLLKEFKPPKKSGLFGMIQSFIDDMALAEEEVNLYSYVDMHYHGHMGAMLGMSYDMLSMERLYRQSAAPAPDQETKKSEKVSKEEQNMEINLLKGFADDIQVSNKYGKLEISAAKKIPDEFLSGYLMGDPK